MSSYNTFLPPSFTYPKPFPTLIDIISNALLSLTPRALYCSTVEPTASHYHEHFADCTIRLTNITSSEEYTDFHLQLHRKSAFSLSEMDISNILKLQTEAAYQTTLQRPQAHPVQASSSSSSLRSESSSLGSSPYASSTVSRQSKSPSLDMARCTRCKRSISIDANNRNSDVISFGTLRYCHTCVTALEKSL